MKKIVLKQGDAGKIAASLDCTREMVSKSLNYKKDSPLARKIRHLALHVYKGAVVEI